jgi:hypothetical protein
LLRGRMEQFGTFNRLNAAEGPNDRNRAKREH